MKESLEESAARHEAHKPHKCLLEQVEVRTGEESESNVLQVRAAHTSDPYRPASETHEKMMLFPVCVQMQCKLFVFEMTSQSWVERGCGVLRLNDMASAEDGTLQSRLGNTLLSYQRPWSFNLRISIFYCEFAIDSGQSLILKGKVHPKSESFVII